MGIKIGGDTPGEKENLISTPFIARNILPYKKPYMAALYNNKYGRDISSLLKSGMLAPPCSGAQLSSMKSTNFVL